MQHRRFPVSNKIDRALSAHAVSRAENDETTISRLHDSYALSSLPDRHNRHSLQDRIGSAQPARRDRQQDSVRGVETHHPRQALMKSISIRRRLSCRRSK